MKFLTLTLAAVLTLAVSVPAEATVSEKEKCSMRVELLQGKFALCLKKADANVAKGRIADTAAADLKCESKFRSGWAKAVAKAQAKDEANGGPEGLGGDCDGAATDAVRDSAQGMALVATGRDLADFPLVPCSIVDPVDCPRIVDNLPPWIIASDNQAVCEGAGGTWESDASCTPANRDCFRKGACGTDGWARGALAGMNKSNSGCDIAPGGSDSYDDGVNLYAVQPDSSAWGSCSTPALMCDSWTALKDNRTSVTAGSSVCDVPTNAQVTGVTATTASLSWDAMDTPRYLVMYRLLGTTAWTLRTSLTNSYEITDLFPLTEYEFGLKAKCSGTWTASTLAVSFTTADVCD